MKKSNLTTFQRGAFLGVGLLLWSNAQAWATNVLRDYYIEQHGGQSFLVLKFDQKPDYEVVNNPSQKNFTVKIRGAVWGKSLDASKTFADRRFLNARLNKPKPNEIWVIAQTAVKDLAYDVLPDALERGYLVLEAYSSAIRQEKIVGKNYLEKISLLRTPAGEEINFLTDKAFSYKLSAVSLPKEAYQIELSNVALGFNPEKWFNDTESLENLSLVQKGPHLLVTLVPKPNYRKTNQRTTEQPSRLILTFAQGSAPIDLEEENRFIGKLTDQNVRQVYAEAEKNFRALDFKQAAKLFKQVMDSAANSELGMRAAFRYADSLNEQQKLTPKREEYNHINHMYETALSLAEKLNLKPSDIALALRNMGDNQLIDGFAEEALDTYTQLVQQFPKSVYAQDAEFMRAEVFFNRGKYAEVVKYYQTFLQKYPSSPRRTPATYHLAQSYAELKDHNTAYTYFNQARNLDLAFANQKPDLLKAMADTYFEKKEFEKALAFYGFLLEHFFDYKETLHIALKVGDYYEQNGERERALQIYLNLQSRPEWQNKPLLRMRLADFYGTSPALNDYKKAVALYSGLQQELMGSSLAVEKNLAADALFKTAITHTLHNQPELALDTLDSFKMAYPKNDLFAKGTVDALTFEDLTMVFSKAYLAEQYNTILTQYFHFREKIDQKKDFFIYWLIANSYVKLSNFQEANRFFQLLLSSHQGHADEIAFAIGDNDLEAQNYLEAKKNFQYVIDHYPESVFSAYSKLRLAKIEGLEKNYTNASAAYQQIITHYQSSADPLVFDIVPEAWFAKGEIDRELGNFAAALDSYRQVAFTFKHPLKDASVPDFVSRSAYLSGDMLKELGEDNQALLVYQKAQQYYPNSDRYPWSQYYMATIYQDQKKYSNALKLFNDLAIRPTQGNPSWKRFANESKREIEANQHYTNYLKGDS